jgi:hypothetical protein
MADKKLPDWLKYNADGSADITLAKPADLSGAKVSVVRMREPTVADQEAASEMSGSDAAREIGTFANLCQLAPDDIRKLSLRDYKRLQVAYLGFID